MPTPRRLFMTCPPRDRRFVLSVFRVFATSRTSKGIRCTLFHAENTFEAPGDGHGYHTAKGVACPLASVSRFVCGILLGRSRRTAQRFTMRSEHVVMVYVSGSGGERLVERELTVVSAPAWDQVKHHWETFQNGFSQKSMYRGLPTLELERAWNDSMQSERTHGLPRFTEDFLLT